MIEILHCDIAEFSDNDFNELLSFCSEKEQESILKYRFQKDRLFKLLGRLMVQYKFEKNHIEFEHSKFGKPFVEGRSHFNISHSGAIAAVAFSENEIGFDIEIMEDGDKSDIISHFHSDEKEYLINASSINDFYLVWTRKESFLKATGIGLQGGLNKYNCLQEVIKKENQSWHIFTNKLIDGYASAICKTNEIDSIDTKEITKKMLIDYVRK